MRFLLDTNIIVDVISRRPGHKDSLEVLKCCELHHAEGFVSATTVTDVAYILRQHLAPEGTREALRTLLAIVEVAEVLKSDILSALASGMKDFEDAVQASCACRQGMDGLVTRNFKDFKDSAVPTLLPAEALAKIRDSRLNKNCSSK